MPKTPEHFSRATREWFDGAFEAPTAAQLGAWQAISEGRHALVVAPTGSGKTLSAFLSAIDRLVTRPLTLKAPDSEAEEKRGTRVLYVSPLKALAVDVERNLRAPLVGITQTARRLGDDVSEVTVGIRSGDTPQAERRSLAKNPPDILITTPESLYLMLTSQARETLRTVDTVIVDEVHAVAATKRGAHLALSLERLDAMLEKPAQRIGLSATVKPLDEVARFLGGTSPVTIVAPPSAKRFDITVQVPVEDLSEPGVAEAAKDPRDPDDPDAQNLASIWPHIENQIVDLIEAHRSTIVFANSRRLSERLTARLNEVYEERQEREPVEQTSRPALLMAGSGRTHGAAEPESVLAKAHHGSVSKEQRAIIEDDLKAGRLRCVVATSSLELGIDMGDVDLVIQVETPPSVASALQRVGRAGHQVGELSRGVIFPKHRADLVNATVAAERMVRGEIETMRVPQNPLDVLAQQTVAAAAMDDLGVEEWFDTVRRSAPFAGLPRSAFDATLDLVAGKYPSDEFGGLRPRVVWDRDREILSGRPGASRVAVTSGGTIPDRGLFGVFLVGADEKAPARVGELDEEMVYESRVGDVFALGTTSWRIEEITHDRVLVTPAFGEPGRLPFWKGDGLGRPAEFGEAIGKFVREVASTAKKKDAELAPQYRAVVDERAEKNVIDFIREQLEETGVVPTDRTLVVERYRDELGDWRVILHSPYGNTVHAPWALAVGARVSERYGLENAAMGSDDGIVVRIPDSDQPPPGAELFVFDPDDLERIVTEEAAGSALFASRFREIAARALLLPRMNPGKRQPLWQQRQRSAQLLDVARQHSQFPMLLETLREVLQDVYDMPALRTLTERIASRSVRVVEVETPSASPFAKSMMFGYVGAFLYEGDSPLAERRAAALSLDQSMLAELLGRSELRELLDEKVLERTERELQRLADDRRMRGAEGIADLVRMLGPLSIAELEARTDDTDVREAIAELEGAKRILAATIAGETRYAAIEDASRLRDALGVPLPIGVPVAFIEPVADPLGDLVSRYARTHGPFTIADVSARFGLGQAVVREVLGRFAASRRITEGEFRPGGNGTEWVDPEVLRMLRSRSLAALRHEVELVDAATLARFLPEWQHIDTGIRRTDRLHGIDGLVTAIDQLSGAPLAASALETFILPARVSDYSPAMLDELTSSGEVLVTGAGDLPGNDGWVSLHLAETASVTLPAAIEYEPSGIEVDVLAALASGGAFFFRQLADATGATDDQALSTAIYRLFWAGLVTNDTLGPIRSFLSGRLDKPRTTAHRQTRRAPRARTFRGAPVRVNLPSRDGPPSVSGRWALAPLGDQDATLRASAAAETLLGRYGIVTRGSVQAENLPGGFALAYRVLSKFEEAGRARRGYFVEKLGAAQFATTGTIDRLRTFVADPNDDRRRVPVVTLVAADPANPFGAALPWPELPNETKHRPARKAGSLVTIVDGEAVLYLERGGKTLVAFDAPDDVHVRAAASLAETLRTANVDRVTIEKVNGAFVLGTPIGDALRDAGFEPNPRGLRLGRQ